MRLISLIFYVFCFLFSSAYAASDRDVFIFSATPPSAVVETEVPKVADKTPEVPTPTDTDKTNKKETLPEITKTKDAATMIMADAEEIIKNKLVQKYQVRLDDVIARMNSKMVALSPENQRTALGDFLNRVINKKEVIDKNITLDEFKKDIILSLLDHIIYRVEGLINESAQSETTKIQA